MNNMKEYNEILFIFKKLIEKDEIEINEDSFNIQYIKNILLTNDNFKNEVASLKEKLKNQADMNKNIFSLIFQINRKKTFETKILLNNLSTEFNFFYNEPKYIIEFNENLYKKISEDINQKNNEYLMISSKKENYIEELFNVKSEFYNNQQFANISPDFILKMIYSIKNNNILLFDNLISKTKNIFNFNLNSHTLNSLKSLYGQLITNWLNTTEEQINNKKRTETLIKLIQSSKSVQLMEMCKEGIPNSLRKNIFIVLMNIENTQISENVDISNDIIYIYDYYILRDAHRITASENYFLFEENLILLLTTLIRDTDIISLIQGTRPIIVIKKEIKGSECLVPFPPSGLFPFQGLAFQLAPFTYMSATLSDYYIVAKFFYAKFLSHITSFTSNQNSILSLLCSFNTIYNRCNCFNELREHFSEINFDPNSISIYWFMTSFATIISPENVLKIYDLVIISNSLGIYILVALSLFYYKRKELINCDCVEDVQKCFFDITFEQVDIIKLLGKFIIKS